MRRDQLLPIAAVFASPIVMLLLEETDVR